MTITAFPLAWPVGWKRTPADKQAFGRFTAYRQDISVATATSRLLQELVRMGVVRDEIVLSTNLQLRLDGLPRSNQAAPRDPGAAVYWRDPYNQQPRSMAIDRYSDVAQNIAALAATIEAMRAIERHGGAVVLERAFTGFAALPAPTHPDWQVVLELQALLLPTRDDIEKAFRRLVRIHHPDHGGTDARMAEINRARAEALEFTK